MHGMVVEGSIVRIGDRDLRVTNLDKVLYSATGTTKGEVIAYYRRIAPVMLPLLAGRPVTRKRWPNGVQSHAFFTKDADSGTPEWVRRVQIQHSGRVAFYPVAEHEADLAWFGQAAALELHVPQWTITGSGPVDVTHRAEWLPDRVVVDLDPGPGAGLPECVQVAQVVRQMLGELGEKIIPVTSGSKGLHLYIPLDGPISSDDATTWAKQIAEALVRRLPTLVTATMSKSLRAGKVFIDWSQNTGAKTTIAPYSLRGRDRPTVAAPRTWAELDRPERLEHLDLHEVLARLNAGIEPFSGHSAATAVVDEPPARERPTPGTATSTSPPPREPALRPSPRRKPATGSPRPVTGRRRPPMQPMLATPGTTTDVRGAGWQVEGKWDGIRALVTVDEHGLAIHSRNGNDVTATFPELGELSTLLPGHTAILDGEIVALDEEGRTNFGLLQQRLGINHAGRVTTRRRTVPAYLLLFDLLRLDGIDLTGKKLSDRRRLLEAMHLSGKHVAVPPVLHGEDLDQIVAQSRADGWEGIVAKRADSVYLPGRRSHAWIKIKNYTTLNAVIVAWEPGGGNTSQIGALLLAQPDPDGDLRYIGKVGSGFSDAEAARLHDVLTPLVTDEPAVAAPASRWVRWVRPELVGEVRVAEITRAGIVRHPSWRGLRADHAADSLRA